jgi:hypothetical protein
MISQKKKFDNYYLYDYYRAHGKTKDLPTLQISLETQKEKPRRLPTLQEPTRLENPEEGSDRMTEPVPALTVIFDEARHEYYDASGKIYPSVTTVLKAGGVYNYDAVPEAQRTAAMDLGTRVHWMLQLFDEGKLDTRKLRKPMRGYLKAWRTWKESSGFIVGRIEHRFISEFGYAGTADRLGAFSAAKHIPVLLDLKTGASIPDWVKIQLAAYVRGVIVVPAWKFTRRIAFQPYPDGTYNVKEYPPSSMAVDFAKFTEALRKIKENNDHGS